MGTQEQNSTHSLAKEFGLVHPSAVWRTAPGEAQQGGKSEGLIARLGEALALGTLVRRHHRGA